MPDTKRGQPRTDTRLRLLRAALAAFGQRDFDAVSIRDIVAAAGVNVAAISYHFGGKRDLYLATADYLAESLHTGLAARLQSIQTALPGSDAVACRRLLGDLLGEFAGILLTDELGGHAPGFVFREQLRPTEAFDILYAKLFAPLHQTMAALVGRARDLAADADETRMVAHALLGQVIAFRAARTTLLRHLGRPTYTADDLDRIAQLLTAMTSAALDYPNPEPPV